MLETHAHSFGRKENEGRRYSTNFANKNTRWDNRSFRKQKGIQIFGQTQKASEIRTDTVIKQHNLSRYL